MKDGVALIESTSLKDAAKSWASMPSPTDFDTAHRQWRYDLVQAAPQFVKAGTFSHGVAAKLINCYLKSIFLAGIGVDHQQMTSSMLERMNCIHPPIDRILLGELIKKEPIHRTFWIKAQNVGWSSFDEAMYEETISTVRILTGGQLWRVEEYWSGYQSKRAPLLNDDL